MFAEIFVPLVDVTKEKIDPNYFVMDSLIIISLS